MTHTLYYDPDIQAVVLCVKGIVTLDRIRELAPQVARLCSETGSKLFLNDMRRAKIHISLLDAYDSPQIMEEAGVSRIIKRALVVPENFDVTDFLATVTRNEGHDFMVFKDIQTARIWLLSK